MIDGDDLNLRLPAHYSIHDDDHHTIGEDLNVNIYMNPIYGTKTGMIRSFWIGPQIKIFLEWPEPTLFF